MEILKNVYQLDCAQRSHVFLIREEKENILIDTGFPGLADQIISELKDIGIPINSIQKILLTHHDIDHIGNLKALQDASGAEIWIHKEDLPYITGEKKRPGIKHIINKIIRSPKPVINNSYTDNRYFGKIKAIHTPGHTPGHTIFQFGKVLFTGDLFKVSEGEFKLLHSYLNWNRNKLRKSIALIEEHDYEILCPSHGEPIRRGKKTEEFFKQYN